MNSPDKTKQDLMKLSEEWLKRAKNIRIHCQESAHAEPAATTLEICAEDLRNYIKKGYLRVNLKMRIV